MFLENGLSQDVKGSKIGFAGLPLSHYGRQNFRFNVGYKTGYLFHRFR